MHSKLPKKGVSIYNFAPRRQLPPREPIHFLGCECSVAKLILISAVILFSALGIMALFKKKPGVDITTQQKQKEAAASLNETAVVSIPSKSNALTSSQQPKAILSKTVDSNEKALPRPFSMAKDDFPTIDRIFQLFTLGPTKLPIVDTIHYSSSVDWLKGRPAWLADYAAHYNTSRHFIARSLNGKPDYFSQKISEGCKFNVFRKDKKIHFYLLVDVSRCKMGFYYVDLDTNERVLLKTYAVGLGRPNPSSPSGSLTPLGRYSLGNRVAIYTPGIEGYYQDQKIEMVKVFGTRWIPFDQEIERVSAPAKGYGLQGAPWSVDSKEARLVENRSCIGAYDSDGCVRMASEDIEELFAIVLTKPTFIEIVKDFHEAKLPGIEVAAPSR